VTVVCSRKNWRGHRTPIIELRDDLLHVKCRPINFWGILNPPRWTRFKISELSGVWIGRVRLFPPTFWMFESNVFHMREIFVLRSSINKRRYYVREFEFLTDTKTLLERLLELQIPVLPLA
jgi:hypothetical protein